MKRVIVLLITLALLVGMVGCPADPDPEPTPPVRYGLTVSSTEGGEAAAPGEGTFAYDKGESVLLVAEADEGYRFVSWTGDVGTVGNVNAAGTTISMNGDYEITANFEVIPPVQYKLTIMSTEGGLVTSPGEGTYTYDSGATVALTAVATYGYGFVKWIGDVSTVVDVNAEITTMTVSGNHAVTATFAELPRYGLTTASNEGGSVTYPGDGTSAYYSGTVVDLVATPDSGHQFVGWKGDVGTVADVSAPTTTITIASHTSIAAVFAKEIWDWHELHGIRDNLDGSYILMNDLDSTTAGYAERAGQAANGGKGWEPIGDYDREEEHFWDSARAFGGALYGQGFEIRNVFINRPLEGEVGLFGFVRVGGIIQDVGVVSFTVSGGHHVAGVVGWSFGTIQNSYAIGIVTGNLVGGLVAYHHGVVINSYYDYDKVRINGHNVITIGALRSKDFERWLAHGRTLDINEELAQEDGYYLIGSVSDFKQLLAFGQDASLRFRLTQDLDLGNDRNFYIPYLAAEFDGNGHKIANLTLDFQSSMVGAIGLFGFLARGGQVRRLGVERVSITCEAVYIGGLVGCNWWSTVNECYSAGSINRGGGLVGVSWGTVTNCYSTASVDGCGGGLVGVNTDAGRVRNCYSVGNVACEDGDRGLMGWNRGLVSGSFWNIWTSGQARSGGGTGKTTVQMKSLATFLEIDAPGLDEPWDIVAVAAGETNPAYTWNIVDGQTYPFLGWQQVP